MDVVTESMIREDGFYWVKYDDRWIPAEWTDVACHGWYVIGNDFTVPDEELQAIGERITEPPQ